MTEEKHPVLNRQHKHFNTIHRRKIYLVIKLGHSKDTIWMSKQTLRLREAKQNITNTFKNDFYYAYFAIAKPEKASNHAQFESAVL